MGLDGTQYTQVSPSFASPSNSPMIAFRTGRASFSVGFNKPLFIGRLSSADKLKPEERCASTSNRNFEGRQGRGGRTHLVSPGMAAAAAISGNLEDVRKFEN